MSKNLKQQIKNAATDRQTRNILKFDKLQWDDGIFFYVAWFQPGHKMIYKNVFKIKIKFLACR